MTREDASLYAVVGAGAIVTIFDCKKKYGGMNYYFKPIRKKAADSTPIYACPAIIGLLNMFSDEGSNAEDLEAHIFGGAANPNVDGYVAGVAEQNVEVAFEILKMKKIRITGSDVGGDRGRKVVFNTSTGESITAKVDKIRSADWYP